MTNTLEEGREVVKFPPAVERKARQSAGVTYRRDCAPLAVFFRIVIDLRKIATVVHRAPLPFNTCHKYSKMIPEQLQFYRRRSGCGKNAPVGNWSYSGA